MGDVSMSSSSSTKMRGSVSPALVATVDSNRSTKDRARGLDCWHRCAREVNAVERDDRLRPPFLFERKVGLRQVGDELALGVGHPDDDLDEVRFAAEDRCLRALGDQDTNRECDRDR